MGRPVVEILLDSVILIDHFNGIAAATEYLTQVNEAAAISVITRAEVLAGFDEDEAVALASQLLDCFACLILDKPIADRAAALRRREGWKLPDAIQAAVAQHHGLKLATRNHRDFSPQKYPFVVVPYSV